jgi:mTERF domain-containing protein
LAYSLERNVRPTVKYLVDEFFPACDVFDAVQLVTYSLKGRIVPRVRILRRKGMMSEQSLHKPSYVVCMRDDQFQRLTGVTPEEYAVEVTRAKDDDAKDGMTETAGAR